MINDETVQLDIGDFDFSPYMGLVDFIPTSVFSTLLDINSRVVVFVTGNRYGKTLAISRKLVYSILGLCPNPEHNIKPDDKCRTIRVASQNLPEDATNEVKNSIYPLIKRQLPSPYIEKDITARSKVITVKPVLGGKNAMVEFVSYEQASQAHAGQERRAIMADEVAPYDIYEESLPRLATIPGGQFLVGCTPVDAGWMYTELYERAKVYIRTPSVRAFLMKQYGQKVPQVERTDSKKDITVLQASSDDNPIFEMIVKRERDRVLRGEIKDEDFPYLNVSEYLDSFFMFDDPDTVAMRRYGVFRQITGAVHKEFNWLIHVIEGKRYFPSGIPKDWRFARAIDYHQSVPWAMVWVALSPDDEAFVWEEMNPDPHTYTTLGICDEMIHKSLYYNYRVNLIDKLATEKQVITNTTTTEDMNRILRERGCLGYDKSTPFESWDDKTTKGEDKVRERLINAKICGKPFNNLQKINGREQRIPTLWIFDNCRETALSLKNWKMETWIDRDAVVTKEPKDKKENKWSHFNKCLEAVFKDARFRATPYDYSNYRQDRFEKLNYFHGGR
jgi:hypothetical protein